MFDITQRDIKYLVGVGPARADILARDLNIFKEYYHIKEISLFEMFPNTHHVESVCLLEKKS